MTQVAEEPVRRGVLLGLVLTAKPGLLGRALGEATVTWWSSGPCMAEPGRKVGLQPWTSGEPARWGEVKNRVFS